MWSKFSAGLQMVQEQLDHVLEGDAATEATDGKDEQESDAGAVVGGVAKDSSMIVASGSHATPDQSEAGSPLSTQKSLEAAASAEGTKAEHPGGQVAEVASLREALEVAEQQTQLLNSEYGRLLREKETELEQLRTDLAQLKTVQPAAVEEGGQQELEVLRKEVTVHKEMVGELRRQLHEKEADFQELNNKAESKFSRLKLQAKARIAALNKEVDKLKAERGEPVLDVSQQSLDDSIVSVGGAKEGTQQQLDALRADLADRDRTITALEEEQLLWQQERTHLQQDMGSLKDKLNVSEVCLSKEQENRVKLELRITEMEEELESHTHQLTVAMETQQQLEQELKREKEGSEALQARLSELTSRAETQGGDVMQRNFSFASSDMQVISEGVSQVDSEEEWKVVHSASGGSPTKSDSSPPTLEVVTTPTSEVNPVLAAGMRGSLLDLESEVTRLETVLQERDEQLSSFKAIFEEKETLIREKEQKEEALEGEVGRLTQLVETQEATSRTDIEGLESQLSLARNELAAARENIEQLEEIRGELSSEGIRLQSSVAELQQQVQQIESELQETRTARDSFEQELWNKMAEVSKLTGEIESQKTSLVERDNLVSTQQSEVYQLRQTLQELEAANEALKANVDGDRQASAKKLASSLEQIRELEQRVIELQSALEERESEVEQLQSVGDQLQRSLVQAEESLQQNESSSQREVTELQLSLKQAKEEEERRQKSVSESLQMQASELQSAQQQRDAIVEQLRQKDAELEKSQREIAQLRIEIESASKKTRELQSELAKTSGALEFAQGELSNRDGTIKSLSQALEEKKASLAKHESEIARVKSETAEKLTEVMQKSEQTFQSKTAAENELRELRVQLQVKDRELANTAEKLKHAEGEQRSAEEELQAVLSQVAALEREKKAGKIETEALRGQVESLSELEASFSQESTKQQEEVSQLQSRVSELSIQVTELQQKLKNAKQQLSKRLKESEEEHARCKNLEADLSRYARENEQMKEQFDSAVKLMESKATEQASTLSRAQQEIYQKTAESTALSEQAQLKSREISELKERVTKLSADYKISSDRCRLLEQDKLQLQQQVSEVTSRHSQLEHSFSEAVTEKESLSFEHHASLRVIQEHETRVLELTNQVAQLAREKEGLEGRLREAGRQLASSEQAREQLGSEVAGLRATSRETENWQREKQALLEDRAALEREKSQLFVGQSSLQAQVQQLQASVVQLQEELQQSQSELEACRRDTAKSAMTEELQKRLTEMERSHSAQLSQLKQSLQEEGERRQAAESSLEELRGEVAIGVEDLQPLGLPSEREGEQRNIVDYLNMASAWTQRFVKNPNIVLTRLLRATAQTKLFLLAYFVLLHLFILYILIA